MNCQHCFIPIEGKICYCPECGFSYHEDCWRKNKSKCVQYGCKGQTEVINNQEEKECPFCAEKIKENAVICRFCNRELVKKEEVLIIGKKNIIEKNPVLNVKVKKADLFKKLLNPKMLFGIIVIISLFYFFSFPKPKINRILEHTIIPTLKSIQASIPNGMVFVEGGSFNMGDNDLIESKPIHKVQLSNLSC